MDAAQLFREAIDSGDPLKLRQLFEEHPEVKAHIDDPLFSFDRPAIAWVADAGKTDMVDALLDAGANINARSQWWAGSFGVLDNDNHELAKYLLSRGAKLDPHAAARHCMLAELRALIDADPQAVHARGGDGQTPLHVAGNVAVAELLLESGADIDARDVDHESTPAQYLIDKHPDIVKVLVTRGCATDLLLACALGDAELVRRHLDQDPEAIHTRVNRECFPMKNSRAGGIIYQWTLKGGASAFEVARNFKHQDIADLLYERAPADLKFAEACMTGDAAIARVLFADDPAAAREAAKKHAHYLSLAAKNDKLEVVHLMLECGWPVEGDPQYTPLHWAGWNGNVAMTRELLLHNPPLEVKDVEHDGTPLGWAIFGSEHGWKRKTGDYPGVAKLLLDAGALPPASISGSAAMQQLLREHQKP